LTILLIAVILAAFAFLVLTSDADTGRAAAGAVSGAGQTDQPAGAATRGRAALMDRVTVVTNSTRQPVRVTGPSPESVLATFCRTARGMNALAPVGVVSLYPPDPHTRMGLFRDLAVWDQPLRLITIRETLPAKLWVAGNGQDPILEDVPAAPVPAGGTTPAPSPETPFPAASNVASP
jgi:hypothetical protein